MRINRVWLSCQQESKKQMMNGSYQNDFKSMQFLHYALLIGVLIFTAVAYFLNKNGLLAEADDTLYDFFRFLVPGLLAVSVLAGRFISQKIFATAKDKSGIGEKLNVYRTGMLIRWAMVEGGTFFALVAYLLTANLVMLIVALAGAIYLFTLRPTPESAAGTLGLSETEYRQLLA
jgi:hypothetical protein